ncbi:transporter [Nostoc linckia z18]|jgi:cadmium resistance transport/sequestration family protein|uniref:Transporter n=2 Tax=Nostoc linckia TaxID=92942 RepID=A0A9Q5ZAM0_NOSLI|nr:cadmium resistance transporter [Nostoc linckia]PHK21709.1 transporter [Nostoc linckia z15]PHK38673.1 transporter [Nostoc linckia z16]PHJ58105.1 transporter [Nostoc linckia z1]PHJ60644.1 transporter [Nostoc linckia z3]PHJ65642.1 transporter [Nostoc linckia z2]
MSWNNYVTAISTGAITFIATNIDDIVILLLFFSQINSTFRPRHIVTGQFLGFTFLVILSLSGLFSGLVLSKSWIGLLGLLPIAIGISSLINQEENSSEEVLPETEEYHQTTIPNLLSPEIYSVAAVTVANGSDNISVYVPLFASSNLESFVVIIIMFFMLLGIWCYTAYKLTKQKIIADILSRYINHVVPFVLIGLGVFIVLKSEALSPIKLAASCFCLVILVKNNEIEDNSST